MWGESWGGCMALSQCEAHFACRLQVFVSLSSRPRGFCASSYRLGLHFKIKKIRCCDGIYIWHEIHYVLDNVVVVT